MAEEKLDVSTASDDHWLWSLQLLFQGKSNFRGTLAQRDAALNYSSTNSTAWRQDVQ